MFLNCSYFLIFLNSGLVTRNNTLLRNMCLLLFHPVSLLIILPAFDDQGQTKCRQVLFSCTSQSVYKDYINFFNFSDQNFSLVIVLSLFLIFEQISAWVFLSSLFLYLKKSVYCANFLECFWTMLPPLPKSLQSGLTKTMKCAGNGANGWCLCSFLIRSLKTSSKHQ